MPNPAHEPSSFDASHTIEQAGHRLVDSIIRNGVDGVYDSAEYTARSYMVSGNGPSAWFYVMWDEDGEIDEVICLYSEGPAAVVRVPMQHWSPLVAQLEEARQR